jgi:hypothetical protein
MYFDFLKDEFKHNPESIDDDKLSILKEISTAIKTGVKPTVAWVYEKVPIISYTKQENNQRELLYKLLKYTEQLEKILKTKNLKPYNMEHPCGEYGIVDLVFKDDDTIYPCEVKCNEGKHDIIGQILKYELYFKLKLNLCHWKKVQALTICNAYNPNTIIELKRHNIIPLHYNESSIYAT